MIALADSFISKRIFGPDRLDHFRHQVAALRAEVGGEEDQERERVAAHVAELEQKIERQLDAIEEGIDPILVGDRIRALKTEREEVEAKRAQLNHARTDSDAIDPRKPPRSSPRCPTSRPRSRRPIPRPASPSTRPSASVSKSTETLARYE